MTLDERFDVQRFLVDGDPGPAATAPSEGLPVWQERLYIGMTKSASAATDFYRLPVNRVIELGQQLTI